MKVGDVYLYVYVLVYNMSGLHICMYMQAWSEKGKKGEKHSRK